MSHHDARLGLQDLSGFTGTHGSTYEPKSRRETRSVGTLVLSIITIFLGAEPAGARCIDAQRAYAMNTFF